jgi:hypothetical protein
MLPLVFCNVYASIENPYNSTIIQHERGLGTEAMRIRKLNGNLQFHINEIDM